MNPFILLMTLQFNSPAIPKADSVIDVYHSAYKTRETCMAEAARLHNVYKPTRPEADVMFVCVGKGESL